MVRNTMIFSPPVPLMQWIIVRLAGYFVVAVAAALAYGGGLAVYNAISGDRSKSAVPHEFMTPQPAINSETPAPSLAPSERSSPVLPPESPPMVQRGPMPGVSKDVVPKDPSSVVGMQIFDTDNRLVGRVVTVDTAPVFTERQGAIERKGTTVFILVQDDKGTRHTIEYGNIKWKATSEKSVPEWGVLVAASATSGSR